MSSTANIIKLINKPLPLHRGNSRIWIATLKINATELANNLSYHYRIDSKNKKLILTTDKNLDDRKITLRGKNNLPLIDINNKEISELFKDVKKISIKLYKHEIVIEPLKEEIEQAKARKKLHSNKITFCEIFAGGGTLSKSLKDAGMSPVAAVELQENYLLNLEANDGCVATFQTNVTDFDFDLLPKAPVLVGGVPCENFCPAGVSKKKSLNQKSAEGGDTGSLAYFFLRAVETVRPAVVLIEQVVGFKNSTIADVVRFVLNARGYKITEKVINAKECGSLSRRKRFCLVATMSNTPFTFSNQMKFCTKTVRDILEVPIEEREWMTKESSASIAYMFAKEKEDIKKGKGFRIARTYLNDSLTAPVTKGYYRNQNTNPILVHPKNEEKVSFFTPREIARINGLPDDYILPEVRGHAGEVVGQGVDYETFYQVGKDIIKHIKSASN